MPAHSRCTSLPLVCDLRQGEAQWEGEKQRGRPWLCSRWCRSGGAQHPQKSQSTPVSLTMALRARCRLSPVSHARGATSPVNGRINRLQRPPFVSMVPGSTKLSCPAGRGNTEIWHLEPSQGRRHRPEIPQHPGGQGAEVDGVTPDTGVE